jgi:putative transposase
MELLLPVRPRTARKGGRPRIQKLKPITDAILLSLLLVGKKTGPNPTDRGKLGCKRSILVDARGVPLSCELAATNTPDARIVQKTLKKRKYRRRRTSHRKRLHILCDKGYDSAAVRTTVKRNGYVPHVARRRRRDRRGRPVIKKDVFRLVVERTHSWANQFRGLKTRWGKSHPTTKLCCT